MSGYVEEGNQKGLIVKPSEEEAEDVLRSSLSLTVMIDGSGQGCQIYDDDEHAHFMADPLSWVMKRLPVPVDDKALFVEYLVLKPWGYQRCEAKTMKGEQCKNDCTLYVMGFESWLAQKRNGGFLCSFHRKMVVRKASQE